MSLISLRHIVKTYQIGSMESLVLKKVSLEVTAGDMLAILGASGSGKSTLMNIIGLLDKPDAGIYRLNERNISDLSADEQATVRNRHIGFVFQQFNLLPRFTAEQNVALPLIYRNVSFGAAQKKAQEALARVGMKPFAGHRPTQLSGGQQQRVAIARALVGEPKVLLADEPTGALDSATGRDVMDLFLTLHQEGRTIILITHDESIAVQCARRITLVDGQIIQEARS